MMDFIAPAFFMAPFLFQDGFETTLFTAASVENILTLPSDAKSEPLPPPIDDMNEGEAPHDTTSSTPPPPLGPISESAFDWWTEV